MTVAEALLAWRARQPFRLYMYGDTKLHIRLGPGLVLSVQDPGYTRQHDLLHVALGEDTTFAGEVRVAVWEMTTGTPSWAVWRLDLMGVMFAWLVPSSFWTWRAALRGRSLYGLTHAECEEVLMWDVDRLRAYVLGDAATQSIAP